MRRTFDHRDLVGRTITDVATAWHCLDDVREEHPIPYLWVSGHGCVEFYPAGDGSLGLALADPPEPFDMGDAGWFEVDHGRSTYPAAALLGGMVTDLVPVFETTLHYECGLILTMADASVGFANIGDDVWCYPWPDSRWDLVAYTTSTING